MPASPSQRQTGATPVEGHAFCEDIVGLNLKRLRTTLPGCLSQADVAARMRHLGFTGWTQTMVSRLELLNRGVQLREVLGLALALSVSPADLLAPRDVGLDIGAAGQLPADVADDWIRDELELHPDWDPETNKVVGPTSPVPKHHTTMTSKERAQMRKDVAAVPYQAEDEQ